MFKWFTKKEEKIEQTVESVNTTHPLMASVEKILNKTNLSPKGIFEEFVRKTYKDNLNSLYQYHVECSDINLNDECLRVSFINQTKTICFYNIVQDKFYYVSVKDTVTKIRKHITPGYDWFEHFLEFYIKTLDTTEDLFVQTKERLQ